MDEPAPGSKSSSPEALRESGGVAGSFEEGLLIQVLRTGGGDYTANRNSGILHRLHYRLGESKAEAMPLDQHYLPQICLMDDPLSSLEACQRVQV